jgi:hypothetical protein
MKPKINFSAAGIVSFFANNGEKIVLGIMLLILLFFLYGAITAKPLDDSKSPDAIVRESEQAKKRISEVDFKDSGETVSATDFQKLINEEQKEVPMAKLEEHNLWDPRLFAELTKRPVPDFFPVQELQIASGYALIPYARTDASGHATAAAAPAAATGGAKIPASANLPGVRVQGADVRPVYYAIITGIVPEEKQSLEYKRKFEYAIRPAERPGPSASSVTPGQSVASSPDEPHYDFFKVQRAEVKNDANDPNLKWVDLDWHSLLPDGGKPEANKWAAQYPEIVEHNYVFPPEQLPGGNLNIFLTWPLPPVYLKYWGLEAAHPKVPLIKPEGAAEPSTQPADNREPTGPLEIPGVGIPGLTAGPDTNKAAASAATPKPGTAAARGGIPQEREGVMKNAAPYRLFRFIDMSAEKGKTYRYRVQLILENPNFNLKVEDLEKPESAKSKYSFSPWSEESAVVMIPPEARILADGVTVARGAGESQGKIHLLTLLQDDKSNDWLEVAKEFELPLGGYASFKDVKIENVPDMSADEVRTITVPAMNADTSMLLDFRNDEALGSGKSKGPTEMLLFDSSGRMTIANSGADAPVLKDYQQRTTITPEAAPATH